MGKIVFITGGCRSGKSAYAQTIAELSGVTPVFIATCPSDLDGEMNARIEKHRQERGERWKNIEESLELGPAISYAVKEYGADIILVDCLTLWINNLMYRAFMSDTVFTEKDVASICSGIIDVCGKIGSDVIFVSNETGMGIVPENNEARVFRDLLGRCNQVIASASDEAFFMVSGMALRLK